MWKPPMMWEGGRCFIIGGGPSITDQFGIPSDIVREVKEKTRPLSDYSPYMKKIHSEHVIGVNAAFMLGGWVEVAFFGDSGFFLKYRKKLSEYKGIKVGCTPKVNYTQYRNDDIKYMPRDRSKPMGISRHKGNVSWNKNSGAAAISLAVQFGVKQIILLGFDMKIIDSQHWHNEYGRSGPPRDAKRLPFHRHLLGFPQIAKDAKKIGVEILNASPDSAIMDFKKIDLCKYLL